MMRGLGWRGAMLALLMAAVGAGCGRGRQEARGDDAPRPSRSAPTSVERNVILVTLDGVRWQEIFRGEDPRLAEAARLPLHRPRSAADLMPNAHRLFFRGGVVLGDPRFGGGIEASGPHFVSLPGYLEILSGARTPCHENDCRDQPPTLLDAVLEAGPSRAAAFTSWEVLGLVAGHASRLVVDSGRAKGDKVPAYPGHQRYRTDRETSALAIDYLLTHRPRFLWMSLGDTDEWAHRGDYRGYLSALRAADDVLGELAAHLEDMGDYGANTVIVVTTDHGRSAQFVDHGGVDSAKVWLFARGPGVPSLGATPTRLQHYLRDVAPTIRTWMGLPVPACEACGQPIEELADPSLYATAR